MAAGIWGKPFLLDPQGCPCAYSNPLHFRRVERLTNGPRCRLPGGGCTVQRVNWSSIFAAGLGSILGSLLTIFATPLLQHHLWKRQRRAEIKLKAIETIATFTSNFIQQWIAANGAGQQYHPTLEWFEEFSATEAVVKALFEPETYEAFKNLEKRVDPKLGTCITNEILNANAFIEARDKAMKALYSEVI